MDLDNISHKRKNILTGEWVLVSPHRNKRPWQGKEESPVTTKRAEYDEHCYLCPGNTRANGEVNPNFDSTFVFVNDFAAIQSNTDDVSSAGSLNESDLLICEEEKGICKVICFSPRHDLTLADMSTEHIALVVERWVTEYQELGAQDGINHVQIFENKGDIMGCSNPHPHGQIWAQTSIPVEVEKKNRSMKAYFEKRKTSILEDYIKLEKSKNERVLFENDDFIALIPFWAVWPFETMILPKKPLQNISQLTSQAKMNYAEAIKTITSAYDAIFDTSFPYSAGIHQSPTDGKDYGHWHFHMSFYPPLVRSATVKKFMVGYEMFGMPQRDITPEVAAKIIKEKILTLNA